MNMKSYSFTMIKNIMENRNILYESITVLNGLLDTYDIKDYIVLEGKLPDYVIHPYIDACSGSSFELKNICKDDFLKLFLQK
jgi:hypothetical protein